METPPVSAETTRASLEYLGVKPVKTLWPLGRMARRARIFNRVLLAVARDPRRLDMGAWRSHFRFSNVLSREEAVPPCGTVACLAGWVQILYGQTPEEVETTMAPYSLADAPYKTYKLEEQKLKARAGTNAAGHGYSGDFAAEVLKLTRSQYSALFFVSNWPAPFNFTYHEAKGAGRVAILRDRLQYFITTGE